MAHYDGGAKVPATVPAIAEAIRWAEEVMRRIDDRWPTAIGKIEYSTGKHTIFTCSRVESHAIALLTFRNRWQ